MTSGFAAASSLQLLRRDTLLQNFSFQPQVLSIVGTAPFEGSHVLGLEGTTATCTQYPTHRQDVRIIKSRSRKRPKRLLHPRALRRRVRSYVHNKPGCRCLIVWGLLVSPPPFRGPRMAGSHFPTATSTHPSQHRFPHQEQPLGSTADCGCPAVQRSHSEGPEWSISRVPQPAVSGAEEDRGSVSRHRSFYIESAPGGAALQNGNIGIYMSSHQDPRMDHILRCKRRLSPCSDAQGSQDVPVIQSEQKDPPVHLSTIQIGNVTKGVPQASKTHSGVVKTAKCQAAHLLGRLADLGRVSRTGPDACPDDHLINAEARMGYQFREVRSNAEPGLPVSGNALKHLTV